MALHTKEICFVAVNKLQQLKYIHSCLTNEKVIVQKRGRLTPDIEISRSGISNNNKYIVIVVTQLLLRIGRVASDHGAPDAGQLLRS